MNDVFWFMVVMMFANILLIKFRIPLISLMVGLVTMILGISVMPMPAIDIPLNPTFSILLMMVSLVAMLIASLQLRG